MKFIEVTAPLSIEQLKEYFEDNSVVYKIKYNESSLKGTKLLTYLSNLDIPSDMNFEGSTEEEVYEFLKDYLHTTMMVSLPSVEIAIINILLQVKGIVDTLDKEFIEENSEILSQWMSKLDSLTLYNMYIIEEETYKEYVRSFEENDTEELEGINFVSLLKHELFYSLYTKIDKSELKYYSKYFNEYMFKGQSLYNFWANEQNPLFLLTFGIASGELKSDEYTKVINSELKEIADATSV